MHQKSVELHEYDFYFYIEFIYKHFSQVMLHFLDISPGKVVDLLREN